MAPFDPTASSPPGSPGPAGGHSCLVNDVHARLNPTRVARVVRPRSVAEVREAVRTAAAEGLAVSIAGGRHAMGGQQFGTGTVLLDTTGLDRVLAFDPAAGEIEVEAGIQWPALLAWLDQAQHGHPAPWGIIQKQTGADRLSLGGALAANIHGRGLALAPFAADVAAFDLLGADGEIRRCSRHDHPELLRLAAGGYGLFGVAVSLRLRLTPRRKLERVVRMLDAEGVVPTLEARANAGFLYGDWQFAIDPASDDFLQRGVCSCYRPVDPATPFPANQRALSADAWRDLLYLAHADKRRAVDRYVAHYLATDGQIYWSDRHQLAEYVDGYHAALDARLGIAPGATGSELISELYVPRPALPRFLASVREDARRHAVDVVYGTVRLIEPDTDTELAWATAPWACVVLNLHVDHTPAGLAKAEADCRRLIDRAIAQGGSFYLTYHRFARRQQVETCYPQFPEFLRQKLAVDPEERFQSDWYRHFRAMFADLLPPPRIGTIAVAGAMVPR
jgi:FAD/FMN-containing dehydrogenase